jgi:hypothetical protein
LIVVFVLQKQKNLQPSENHPMNDGDSRYSSLPREKWLVREQTGFTRLTRPSIYYK